MVENFYVLMVTSYIRSYTYNVMQIVIDGCLVKLVYCSVVFKHKILTIGVDLLQESN